MSASPLANAVRGALSDAMANNSSIVVLGETAGRGGGLWGGTAGLMSTFGPDRVRDLPVSDRAMVGLAVGLALAGQVPVVELSSTHRLVAVAEALLHIASIAADTAFSPTLVVRVPYGQHAGPTVDLPIGSIALPGVRVVCARSPESATQLLADALKTPGATVLLEPRAGLSAPPTSNAPGCDVVRTGSHMTIVAWGADVSLAIEAADQLAADGLDAEVIDAVTIAPLDVTGLCASVRKTGRLIVLHPNDSQLSNNVVQAVVEGAFLYLEAPPARATTLHQVVAAARESATW